MLFADVRGSTAIAERMLPQEFSRLLARFYGTAAGVIAALGDTVNTAARLAGLAGVGEILISADAATAGGFESTGLERRTLELRGREQRIDAWVARAPT